MNSEPFHYLLIVSCFSFILRHRHLSFVYDGSGPHYCGIMVCRGRPIYLRWLLTQCIGTIVNVYTELGHAAGLENLHQTSNYQESAIEIQYLDAAESGYLTHRLFWKVGNCELEHMSWFSGLTSLWLLGYLLSGKCNEWTYVLCICGTGSVWMECGVRRSVILVL